jgi:hypothetical protein
MQISKTHLNFIARLGEKDVLVKPEKYLGSNFQKVLDFWMILDNLSDEQLLTVGERFVALEDNNLIDSEGLFNNIERAACSVSPSIIIVYFSVTPKIRAARYATLELIGNVENPCIVPMFDYL